jgi:hypothetical protein
MERIHCLNLVAAVFVTNMVFLLDDTPSSLPDILNEIFSPLALLSF